MSRTRPSKAATDKYFKAGRMHRRPASLRSYKLAQQSQDLLDDAVHETLRQPELQPAYDLCYGNGAASRPFDEDSRYLAYENVLGDYDWQLGKHCKVPSQQLNARWGVSHVPNSWDDLQPSKLTMRDYDFDSKLKQCGASQVQYRYVYSWVPTDCYSTNCMAGPPYKREYSGTRLLRQRTHFDLLLPAGVSLYVPDESPLAGLVSLAACAVRRPWANRKAIDFGLGCAVHRIACASTTAWCWRQSANLPRGWLLLNGTNFTLNELTKLPVFSDL